VLPRCGGIFDYDVKAERLEEVLLALENPDIWQDPDQAQSLTQERAQLLQLTETLDTLSNHLSEAAELYELAMVEADTPTLTEIAQDIETYIADIEKLEFRRMFSGEMDSQSAYLDVQSGSGGTEAQDWAEMLLRMYLRWGERQGFGVELIEASPGDVAGIKSATIKFTAEYAYGWLKTETGVHRLVRKSPFDSGNRRHTSFAAVFVSPEVNDDIDIAINPADLRVDTYRASGAGGQHVNKTDSAVRITHLPSGVVVQCQNDRSQHKNRAQAMKLLKSRLYERELQARQSAQNALEESKSDISWGSQIRSYVLDASRIKDLRTHVEISNTQDVLDGGKGLDKLIVASLKQGVVDE